eukprot:8305141-Prorocentrum_lima.AAC.1
MTSSLVGSEMCIRDRLGQRGKEGLVGLRLRMLERLQQSLERSVHQLVRLIGRQSIQCLDKYVQL